MEIITISENRWEEYKALRLEALKNVPEAYGSSYEDRLNATEENWRNKLRGDDIMLFVEDKGVLIGMAGCEYNKDIKTEHCAYIFGVYVKPEFQNMGVASMLISEIIKRSKEKGVEKLELNVSTTQANAIKLYRKFGFYDVGLVKKALKINGKYYDEFAMEAFI